MKETRILTAHSRMGYNVLRHKGGGETPRVLGIGQHSAIIWAVSLGAKVPDRVGIILTTYHPWIDVLLWSSKGIGQITYMAAMSIKWGG